MRHDDAVYLRHMLETVRRARAKAGADRERFDAEDTLQLALVHLIQILGEAARRVSDQARARHPDVPWSQIIGMRHRVVHEYLSVDLDIVWSVVAGDLPGLERLLTEALERGPGPDETSHPRGKIVESARLRPGGSGMKKTARDPVR